jgi:hypothetical protein
MTRAEIIYNITNKIEVPAKRKRRKAPYKDRTKHIKPVIFKECKHCGFVFRTTTDKDFCHKECERLYNENLK